MADNFEQYLAHGVESIVTQVVHATLKDPKESAFMAKYVLASREATKRRAELESGGEHIPPFLIASISSQCNLHCVGCYARANHSCTDGEPQGELTDGEWLSIFREAETLGVGFILLAGGEPLLRRRVLENAAGLPKILFPIFTNGTLLDDEYLELFSRSRNLFPVFSIEGQKESTDRRRGAGTYQKLSLAVERMSRQHLMFGASVTVTVQNLEEVTSHAFLDSLAQRGCKIVFYIEYVPVAAQNAFLAPGDAERELLRQKLDALRTDYGEMLFLSFPGDEKASGGCLAAGRGFFHINAHGGAEPCPFSPHSDTSLRDVSLREALRSPLFGQLRAKGLLQESHIGGCTLFAQKEQVKALLKKKEPETCG